MCGASGDCGKRGRELGKAQGRARTLKFPRFDRQERALKEGVSATGRKKEVRSCEDIFSAPWGRTHRIMKQGLWGQGWRDATEAMDHLTGKEHTMLPPQRQANNDSAMHSQVHVGILGRVRGINSSADGSSSLNSRERAREHGSGQSVFAPERCREEDGHHVCGWLMRDYCAHEFEYSAMMASRLERHGRGEWP